MSKGTVLIFGIPAVVGLSGVDFWRLTAIIAIAVGIIHGVIFWVVCRRQRQIRRKSIRTLQAMLADVVKNRLTAIDMYLPEEVDGIQQSIREIAEHVDNLSEETLEDWEETYSEALGQTAEVTGVNQN